MKKLRQEFFELNGIIIHPLVDAETILSSILKRISIKQLGKISHSLCHR